jgi:hypothetical protein
MANAKDKMENQEADIEKEEVDDTAEKAKEIGRELGAKEDDLPDYEVIEETEDKPLAKEREDRPKIERKQLTNKEKRDLRKKRVQEKFQAKDAIIEQQQTQINQLVGRLNEFEGRLSNVDRAKVDDLLAQSIASFTQAEKDHMDAFKEGDGEKATRAMRTMYDAQKRIDQLQPMKKQLEAQPSQPQREQPSVDPIITRKANEWAKKHDWYRADGSDEDSEIAKAISAKMVNEGFDPKSDDFWDELDDRLDKRGIGVQEEDDEEEIEEKSVPKRRAPPVSGSTKRSDASGRVQVTLPTAYINHLKDKGWWDDPVMKKKMIGRYLETQKQNQG